MSRRIAATVLATAVVVSVPLTTARPVLLEDSTDPAYSCRLDGNQMCGLLLGDAHYVVGFAAGIPVSVERIA